MASISLTSIFDAAASPFNLGKEAEPPKPVVETESEGTGNPMDDYVVELSEAARKLAESDNPYSKILDRAAGGAAEDEEEEDEGLSIVQKLRAQIKQVQQEIQELMNDASLSPEARQLQLAVKQTELAGLQNQLQEAMKAQQGLSKLQAKADAILSGGQT